MDNVPVPPASAAPAIPASAAPTCPRCHLPVPPNAYFCPNCGVALTLRPLSTSVWAQAWLYFFSIALPVICYIAIKYWAGPAYFRSTDPKEKRIGTIAIILMAVSTVVTFGLGIIWIQQFVQSSVSSINNLSGLGGAGSFLNSY